MIMSFTLSIKITILFLACNIFFLFYGQYWENVEACTVGTAMGTATADGRPICWKSRDKSSDGNNHLFYSSANKYKYIGIGSSMMMQGLNEKGVSVGNSVVSVDSSSTNNFYIMSWILKYCATVEDIRDAIIDETELGIIHWNKGSYVNTGGCFPFMDAQGNAILFEVGNSINYEYDPQNANRLSQFPKQFVVRANSIHRNNDHTDDSATGGLRYTLARDNFQSAADSGDGITIQEVIAVARLGEPGVDQSDRISRYKTVCAMVNHGVKTNEDPAIATMWASVGQPDYCIFVPVWVEAGNSLSSYLTSSNDTTSISGRSWELYKKKDSNGYDEYINSFYQGIEANFHEAVEIIRAHWLMNGFNVEQADSLSDEAAETAWHTMNSMCQSNGRNLNMTPELTDISINVDGYTVSFAHAASDEDGSIVSTNWDFGDNSTSNQKSVLHTYSSPGAYLVRCRVTDDDNSRNSKWKLVYISDDATPIPTIVEIRDGTGTDIDSDYSTAQLSANWDASTVPQSPISKFWYAIGTTEGGTEVKGWSDNGTDTSTTVTGLVLTTDATYYFSVKAENSAGLQSAPISSDGVTILKRAIKVPTGLTIKK